MAVGAVIENLSTRKLLAVLAAFASLLATFVLVGVWYTPAPSSAMEFLMTKCADPSAGKSGEWFFIRPMNCKVIPDLADHRSSSPDVRDIVFVAQMPHARDGVQLEYSPWFQFLLGLLELEVPYDERYTVPASARLRLEVRMAYRTHADDERHWRPLVEASVDRQLDCSIDPDKRKPGAFYNCSTLDLFELGAAAFPFYLLNIRIPYNRTECARDPQHAPNCRLGVISDLTLVAIHQNGGFTSVWLWMKTLVWPVVALATWWFQRRLARMKGHTSLNEDCILALGVSLCVLDFPFEWVSLWTRASFLLLVSDLRQGLFYTVLFSFWLVFAGEHLVDERQKRSLRDYWRNLSAVGVASLSLLLYDLFERGVQLLDPFHSIWASRTGAQLARLTIGTAGLASAAYFCFLALKVRRAWRALQLERARLYRQKAAINQLKVQGVIYRFKFLFTLTLACALLTIISYMVKQYGEGQLHGEEFEESWLSRSTGAFFTGTFGLWNIYVLLLLVMYAPSRKYYPQQRLQDESVDLIGGGGQFEASPLTTFLKPGTD